MTRAEETPPYNLLLENEKQHSLFTDCSCHIIGINKKFKTVVWSPTWWVSSYWGTRQIQSCHRAESHPAGFRYFWMRKMVNTLPLHRHVNGSKCSLVWLNWWKKGNWQQRKSHLGCWIVATYPCLGRDVDHESTSSRCTCTVSKNWVPEEHCNNDRWISLPKLKYLKWIWTSNTRVSYFWLGEMQYTDWLMIWLWKLSPRLFITVEFVLQSRMCVKPLWYGGQWSKHKHGQTCQTDYITVLQTCQGKHYMLTIVEKIMGWLQMYPVRHTAASNTILGLEKQIYYPKNPQIWTMGLISKMDS